MTLTTALRAPVWRAQDEDPPDSTEDKQSGAGAKPPPTRFYEGPAAREAIAWGGQMDPGALRIGG